MKTTRKSNSANNQSSSKRDGSLQSMWQPGTDLSFSQESLDLKPVYDVLVIGGGITGLTAALTLQVAGKKCILADSHSIAYGTTGGTSAHINTFADTTYKEAEDAFGEEGAKLFSRAVNEGFDIIRENIKTYKISCDYEPKSGYVYAEDEKQLSQLNDLYSGTVKVGVKAEITNDVPTPVPFLKGLVFPDQAQFHPLKYIRVLLEQFLKKGGLVLENTRIEDTETENGIHTARSGNREIKAKKILYATHIPPGGINLLHFRAAPYRSYVIGVKLTDEAYPDALVYDMQEPYHYFRTHEIEGQKYLLAGGNDHKTGHDDPEAAFSDLEKYVRQFYKVSSVDFRWSSQYFVPTDGLPYIGQLPMAEDGIFCATGYNGNGMMLGSIAGRILSDLASGKKNKYEELFDPRRVKPVAGFMEFVKENADVAYHFIADRVAVDHVDSFRNIKKDTGEVIEYEGKKIAAYKDKNGKIHALNPICPHAKCVVNWNNEEKTWDCPCHGARFNFEGVVQTGPARRNLEAIEVN